MRSSSEYTACDVPSFLAENFFTKWVFDIYYSAPAADNYNDHYCDLQYCAELKRTLQIGIASGILENIAVANPSLFM